MPYQLMMAATFGTAMSFPLNPPPAQGLVKPFVYAFVVSLIGCYFGLRTSGGTQGVGRATTQAVVAATVLIFVLDFLITKVFVWWATIQGAS